MMEGWRTGGTSSCLSKKLKPQNKRDQRCSPGPGQKAWKLPGESPVRTCSEEWRSWSLMSSCHHSSSGTHSKEEESLSAAASLFFHLFVLSRPLTDRTVLSAFRVGLSLSLFSHLPMIPRSTFPDTPRSLLILSISDSNQVDNSD